jgi:two-component system CheB/CheR fusion protein
MSEPADIDRYLRLRAEQTSEHAEFVMDPAGTILWCNATAAHIFGYSRDALVGQPSHILFTPEDVEQHVPDFELEVARKSTDIDNDRWMMRADGSRFWATGSTTALRDGDGAHVGFGKILRNRTDVKERLELLRNQAEALTRADAHKNVFLSTLSHELRNPLAPLSNAVELIRMTAADSAALQYPLKLIERQVEFIRRLVDDLLDVTRIGAGKVELQLDTTDIKDVIVRAAEMTRPLVTQRRQRFEQHLLEAPMPVKADHSRLEQVFVNLFTNAVKYTPECGRIEVRATLEQTEAIVHVRDDGIGIPTDLQPHIFNLFTQAPGATERAEGGLGIGLSVVKNLVELHGGTVQVRSEGEGKGSEFTVRLPLAESR